MVMDSTTKEWGLHNVRNHALVIVNKIKPLATRN